MEAYLHPGKSLTAWTWGAHTNCLFGLSQISLQTLSKAVDKLKKEKKIGESSTKATDSKTKNKAGGSNFSQPGIKKCVENI